MAALTNRQKEWMLTVLAIVYELLLTLSFLAETGGLVALKRMVKLPSAYSGNLEAELAAMEWQLPGPAKALLALPAPARLLFASLLPLLLWLVVGKVVLKLDGLRGWGWPVTLFLALALPIEAAAQRQARIVQRQRVLREAVENGAYQISRSITFYERVTVGLLALVAVMIVLELLCTGVSVHRSLHATEILIPVFLLCFWGVLLQTAGGGVRTARTFLVYIVMGLLAALALSLLGALRLNLRACYRLCIAMIVLAVVTCVFGNLSPVNGSGAWVRVFGVSVQTGELFKIFVVLFGAYAFPFLKEDKRLNTLFYGTCLVLCVALLLENDSGNMMILLLLVIIVAFLDDYFVGICLTLCAFVGFPLLMRFAAAYSTSKTFPFASFLSHISSRFSGMMTVLERPDANPAFRATLLALLKGGLLGCGVSESRSSFFPTYAACADYAFATILAVWGIGGAIGLLFALLLLLHNADVPFRFCRRSENYLAGKLATSVLAIQATVHVGAALNLTPFLGTNFPFVSSGGSSMVTSWMLIGIILSTRTQDAQAKRIYDFFDRPWGRMVPERLKAAGRYAFLRKEADCVEPSDE